MIKNIIRAKTGIISVWIIIFIALFIGITISVDAADVVACSVYVSVSGNDSTGDGTQEKPYATLVKAYDKLYEVNGTNGTVESNKIYLLSDITKQTEHWRDSSSHGIAATICGISNAEDNSQVNLSLHATTRLYGATVLDNVSLLPPAGTSTIRAQGQSLKITETVTRNTTVSEQRQIHIYGGKYSSNGKSTSNLEIYGGRFNAIYTGSYDTYNYAYPASVFVGGNAFVDVLYGGGYKAVSKSTNVIVQGNATVNTIYGGDCTPFGGTTDKVSILVRENAQVGTLYAGSNVTTSSEKTATVTNVDITIENGKVDTVYLGGKVGNTGSAAVNSIIGNVNLNISGGTITNLFFGSEAVNDNGVGKVNNVSAVVTGGTVTNLYYGGQTGTGNSSSQVGNAILTLSGTSRSSIGTISGAGISAVDNTGVNTVTISKLIFENYCKSCGEEKTISALNDVDEIHTTESGVVVQSAANNGRLVLDNHSTVSLGGSDITTSSLATITEQPADAEISAGGSAELTIAVQPQGEGTVTYQWYENLTEDSATSKPIEGATAASYTAAPEMGRMYYGCQIGIPGITGIVDTVSLFSDFAAVTVSAGEGISVIYVSSAGDDSNDGSYDRPVKTLGAAYDLLPLSGTIETNRIVIMDSFTDDGQIATHQKYNKAATIRGFDEESTLSLGAVLRLNADLCVKKIGISGNTTIRCRGYSFTSDEDVTVNNSISIFAGEEAGAVKGTPNITIKSGKYGSIYAGSNNGNGNTVSEAVINIQGGEVSTIIGGCNSTTNNGSVSATSMESITINISGGKVTTIYGGGFTGSTVKEHSTTVNKSIITVAGGEIGTLYAGGRSSSTHGGVNTVKDSVINISGGTIGTLVGTGSCASGTNTVESSRVVFADAGTATEKITLNSVQNVQAVQVEQSYVSVGSVNGINKIVFFDQESQFVVGENSISAAVVTVTKEPQNATVTFGESALLSVEATLATGDTAGTLGYQWYSDNGTSRLEASLIDGFEDSSFTVDKETYQVYGTHDYFCIVYNEGGTANKSISDAVGYAVPTATVSVTPISSEAVTYYVDVASGDDVTGDGTQEKPWKSITQAKEYIRRNKGGITADITVEISGGTYRLDETIDFEEADSGYLEQMISYVAAEGDEVIITSAKEVSGFTAYQKGIYVAQLPEADKVNGSWPAFRDLLVNGKKATRARTTGWNYFADCTLSPAQGESGFYIKEEDTPDITSWDGVELVYNREWYLRRVLLDGVSEAADGKVQLDFVDVQLENYLKAGGLYSVKGYGYWLENHLDFLDEPGEWYYDQTAGRIYYYPYEDEIFGNSLTASVEYPMLEQLMTFSGTTEGKVSNILLDGLCFNGTTSTYVTENGFFEEQSGYEIYSNYMFPGAVYGSYVDNLIVKNCCFYGLGNNCLMIREGSSNVLIDSNRFEDSAMSAIVIGDAFNRDVPMSRYCDNIIVRNNLITNVSMDYMGSAGINALRTVVGLDIVNNTLSYLPYTGITVGYGCSNNVSYDDDIHIEGNWIENTMYALSDGSGIYVRGGSPYTDHTIKNNVVISNGSSAQTGSKGIYLDCGVRNYTVQNNLVLGYLNHVVHVQTATSQWAMGHKITDNWFTLSKQIKGKEAAATYGNTIENNVTYKSLEEMPDAAKDIYNAAGSNLSMRDLLVVDRENKHIQIPQQSSVAIDLKISNTTSVTRTYNIQTVGMPTYVEAVIADVTVGAGETKDVQLILSLQDNAPQSSGTIPVGLKIVDQYGHAIVRNRIMSVQVGTNLGDTIYKYTPIVDGIMEEEYLYSAISLSGSVFHMEGAEDSDVTAVAYLLWDEQYLYAYIQVTDPQVISRGSEWISSTSVPYCNDNVEVYFSPYGTASIADKYAVDAYGAAYYHPDGKIMAGETGYPFATKLTKDGVVLEYTPAYPVGAGTHYVEANGYVIEMAIPVTAGTEDGSIPINGTEVYFHYQNNDLQTWSESGVTFAALMNSAQMYTMSTEMPTVPSDDSEEGGDSTGDAGNGESGDNTSDVGNGESGDNTGDTGSGESGDNTGDTGSGEGGDNTGDAGNGEGGDNTGDAGSGVSGDNTDDTGNGVNVDNWNSKISEVGDNTGIADSPVTGDDVPIILLMVMILCALVMMHCMWKQKLKLQR